MNLTRRGEWVFATLFVLTLFAVARWGIPPVLTMICGR